MKIKITIIAFMAFLGIIATAQNPATEIKNIQKNTAEYICAESTAPTEEEGRNNALRQIIDMSRNFVETNNNGANISDDAIKNTIQEIIIPRGEFKRVFLYVSRADLISASNDTPSKVPLPGDNPIHPSSDDSTSDTPAPDTPASDTPASDTLASDTPTSDSIEFEEPAFQADEDFAAEVPDEISVEIDNTSSIPPALQELIGLIHNSQSLMDASDILYRYKNRKVLANYGVPRESHSSAASYWVVEDNGKISVLGPEIRGYRKNFRTGQPDALHRYSKGLWFRKR